LGLAEFYNEYYGTVAGRVKFCGVAFCANCSALPKPGVLVAWAWLGVAVSEKRDTEFNPVRWRGVAGVWGWGWGWC
jgi:hypothetical protein